MTASETIALLQSQFGSVITGAKADALDPFVTVEPAELVNVCVFLRDDPRLKFALLNDITGVDYLEPDPKKVAKAGFEPHVEVLYHLSSFAFPGRRFTLKLVLPRWKSDQPGQLPEVPSVAGVWKTADWHEREVYDLVGVFFTGHPNLVRILLNDDWVGHPLRKDYEFPLEYHGIRCR
ncbi:NADH-quinone oxidoreductase subunit C 1 [Gemmata obscuriglobus]|uniref:NADH-quinone oxidoreductase subunit C n=1 Tax=Gemmata obscuriglobus TaxID=114 RepID=A0A2Z3HCT3_9BACT|nr:NADH-quinone oxidoreductase subunit C [Gemmata obscuriglobus]AWM41536.1 NADH-quinone oxidoreductase subunit C [Gemmata obscuriglobus]QEG32552.1 NADH-quinone oxidoreductase subunit C 1 [Gemmata obscuriglobus]VTS11908.1 nadh dehydrogenase : NADH-quinone oxidoreductase subunit C OS=uncultured planctomycete GN=nuoC PE=3 SV=1: Complex1_30kDa [Gemmata obscuriglobus UQM 2246]